MRGNWLPKSQPALIPGSVEGLGWLWFLFAIFFSIFCLYLLAYSCSGSYQNVTVYKAEDSTIGHGYGNSSYHRRLFIYTDKGKFECASSAVFNLSPLDKENIFKSIKSGNKYLIRTAGWTSKGYQWTPIIVSAIKIE